MVIDEEDDDDEDDNNDEDDDWLSTLKGGQVSRNTEGRNFILQ